MKLWVICIGLGETVRSDKVEMNRRQSSGYSQPSFPCMHLTTDQSLVLAFSHVRLQLRCFTTIVVSRSTVFDPDIKIRQSGVVE